MPMDATWSETVPGDEWTLTDDVDPGLFYAVVGHRSGLDLWLVSLAYREADIGAPTAAAGKAVADTTLLANFNLLTDWNTNGATWTETVAGSEWKLLDDVDSSVSYARVWLDSGKWAVTLPYRERDLGGNTAAAGKAVADANLLAHFNLLTGLNPS